MGIFDKLGGALNSNKGLNVEEYMNSEEMENVDMLNEPADFYVKPVALQQESDLALIQAELQKKNIILLNTEPMKSRQNTLTGMVNTLKTYVDKINGDIAVIAENKILITPTKVKIIKSKKPAQKR
jgi:hypothetical protein